MFFPRLLLSRTFFAILVAVLTHTCYTTEARLISREDIRARQGAAAQRFKPTFASITAVGVKNITFSNPKASRTHRTRLS